MEIKHFEFLRLIRTFKHSSDTWKSRGEIAYKRGRKPYALRQAAIYNTLKSDAIAAFIASAEPKLMGTSIHSTVTHAELVKCTMDYRKRFIEYMRDLQVEVLV